MKKIVWAVIILVVLVLAIPVSMVATGTVSTSSFAMLWNVMTGGGGDPVSDTQVKSRYTLPPGFEVSVYADNVAQARMLRFTETGDLLVTRPQAGDVVLLHRDEDGDGVSDGMTSLLSGLTLPLGIDLHEGVLYVAEKEQVGRVGYDSENRSLLGDYEVIIDGLTGDGNHWQKVLRVGPDSRLYLTQGSTCNVCVEEDMLRATMTRYALNGSNAELVATGLRNSVGFDWAPWSGELYATDNGRDLLGDDYPPCELNKIEAGGFYGWPYFHANNEPDPDMGSDPFADERTPIAPVHGFRAHNAPLGIRFIDPTGLPPEFERSAMVALHGSWNRSEPDGYKVVSLHWTNDGIEERPFLDGFNVDGDIIGRPVDVVRGPDGAMYVSDDYAGAIYRIVYTGA